MKEILRTIGGGQNSDPSKKGVVMGQLKKKSERLDAFGNVIDPDTKQIIKPNEEK